VVDRAARPDYKPPLPAETRLGRAQVAQLVEHATENRSVGGSIPPLGTTQLIELIEEIVIAAILVIFVSILVAT
jgi:hypothetical protein